MNPATATKLTVISDRSSVAPFLPMKLNESRPIMVHLLGTYGYMVTHSHFRSHFLGLIGDSYLDSPPPILTQTLWYQT
jgi:hypothetical protein